jgi:DNA-directed RNA polymerase specialized sigma24 family protein
MDIRQKINRLKEYLSVVAEHKEVYDAYRMFISQMEGVGAQTISDMPKGNNQSDKMAANMAKLEELEQRVAYKLSSLLAARLATEETINSLDSSVFRRILHLRYIEGLKWEEICVKTNYSWRQVHRYHVQALEIINV